MNSTSIEANGSNYLKYKGEYKGLAGWIFSTDHKRIGLLYLYSIAIMFSVGALLGVAMKLELLAPGKTIMEAQSYNAVFTIHGIIMIFMVVVPGLSAVFGNFMLPIMIGAKDLAFPKINLLSWWLYVGGVFLVLSAILFGTGTPDTGWTFYVPYSLRSDTNMLPALFGAVLLAFSSILTGLNFLVTIHRKRCPGMKWTKMPLFVWTLYSTSWIQILATPVIGITLVLVALERIYGIGIFDPALGGDPVLFQHLFWIYSHSTVYIIILPAMGAISEIIPTFSQKQFSGYITFIASTLAIAVIGYLGWGHHMFTSGMSSTAQFYFSLLAFLVAIPGVIIVFSWLSTMYKGAINIQTPFYWAASFIFVFMIGGLSGLVLGAVASNIYVHDTAFVVAHFHYLVFGGAGFAFFAALHYWFPKIFGRMYDKNWANIGWLIFFVGFVALFSPMFYLGLKGMPRRYYDYLEGFHGANILSTMGSWILITGLVIIIVNLIHSARKGEKAEMDPWHGKTLEWTISSPPPVENYAEIPVLDENDGPYNYK